MVNVSHLIKRCAGGRKSTLLCLNNRTTMLDRIEVMPGLEADVFIKGHPATNGRKYIPTVVELDCKHFAAYLKSRRKERRKSCKLK